MPNPDTSSSACSSDYEMSILAKKLNQLMLYRSIDTKTLHYATGISIPAINNLRKGKGNPTLSTLISLAQYFNISLNDLIYHSDIPSINDTIRIRLANISDIGRTNINNGDGVIVINNNNLPNDNDMFAIEVNNNSLSPFFEKGSLFIISPHTNYTDGDIVLVSISNQTCFRRIFINDTAPFFKQINFDSSQLTYSDFTIHGVAVKVIQSWR